MTNIPATVGVILAGGASRRMGGGDKALRYIAGRTLLDRVIARLAPQCESLILSCNDDPTRWNAFGLPVIVDTVSGRRGPLAGILSALDWMSVHRTDLEWMLSVSADCPFLPIDLVARLHQARHPGNGPLAIAVSGGRIHPVIALWHVSLTDDLRDALDQGVRKASAFVERHKHAAAEWPVIPFDPFFNVNTPADLAEATRVAALADNF